MTTEEEFKKWLNRPKKSFNENLQFGVKACKSFEFALQSKYDIVINWFCDGIASESNVDWDLLSEFVSVSYPPGLVLEQTKERLVHSIIETTAKYGDFKTRTPAELLHKLGEHQALQSFYRGNTADYWKLEASLFLSYLKYVEDNAEFVASSEHEFFSKCLTALRSFIQRSTVNVSERFAKYTLKPFIETILLLKKKNLKYYDDTFEICKLFMSDKDTTSLAYFDEQPLHVFLYCMDYAVNYFREQKKQLAKIVNLLKDQQVKPEIALKKSAHVLELFRKYDVSLDFQMDDEKTAVDVLAAYIQRSIEDNQRDHLYDILTLVCSAIKLNPMILEKIIFQVTTTFLMMPKSAREWSAYEEFLGLLIEMFRKLSRAEKLVLYLLKSVKLYLQTNGLKNTLKRKMKKESRLNSSKKLIKLEEQNGGAVASTTDSETNWFFVNIAREEFQLRRAQSEVTNSQKWKHIAMAWPYESVGVQFSKFVSTLMSKPSLVVWKTLIFSLAECIEQLKSATLDEHLLVLIDFNSALLCQYLAGTRLPEQSDKFWTEINNSRTLTQSVLRDFGQALLEYEHNNRTMEAFLEISYHIGCFDLITWYYSSDSLQISAGEMQKLSRSLHEYLTQDEWVSLEQRVVNFGKNNTKINMNRLHLQKMKARVLFPKKPDATLNVTSSLLSSTLNDVEQTKAIFGDSTNFWLTQHLSRDEKRHICEILIIDNRDIDSAFLRNFVDDREFFELIILTIYKFMTTCFESKRSTLKLLDFEQIFKENRTKAVVAVINTKAEQYSIKKYSSDELKAALNVIMEMPVGFCSGSFKATLFAINLALYKDVLATHDDELLTLSFELFSRLLHFGEPINMFAHFDIEMLIRMFPPSKVPEFYEFIFSSVNKLNQSTEACLLKVYDLLKSQEPQLSEDLLKLSIILLQYLSHQTSSKVAKEYHGKIILSLVEHIKDYFSHANRDQDEDKEFVEKTLPVFPIYINHIFAREKQNEEITEELRKVCKIFIGHSINCQNPHAIKLIAAALLHRSPLHFDPDEIQFVLQEYWNQITTDARTGNLQLKNVDNALKLIIDNKSNEEFMNIFIDIEKDLQGENFEYACRMLTQIATCQLPVYKGAILNEYFKRIMFAIILCLERTPNKQFASENILLNILESHQVLCDNKKIPLSVDHMDDILTFMMDVNIKIFPVNETNIKYFQNLYKAVTGVCLSLIRSRHLIVLDRVPQFVHIFKGLLQAICWYRCERPKDMNLETEELEELAELAHNLENLMHSMANHTIEMKRIAPYLLTYTIGLMVMNKRSTTLYPKIKTHIENICHELIGLCDHRVGSFVLRCSNDATKQVYETLCKEYKKYRKFKGKV